MKHASVFSALRASVLAISAVTSLSVGAADFSRLGKDLTPSGAERAGNKDGTIPEWTGGITKPPAGWSAANGYADPFKDEKPLFKIDSTNVDKYKDKLSAGEIALLKKYPNLNLPVYPSHRTFSNPQSVYDATAKQAPNVKLNGLTISGYDLPGVPFPIPENGVEAMYNHLTRFIGSYKRCSDWLPVRANGDYYRVGFCEDLVQGQNFDVKRPNHVFSFYGGYDAPATLQGTVYLVHDPIQAAALGREAWIYNAGQRRVRRAPDLAYDAPTDGDEGMRAVDDFWGFNGAMDRYDWKLIGKQEMYIPYNVYKANDHTLKYKNMVDKGSLKPDIMRYELHRVWKVEATLKKGVSHVYSKRDFYLDEDSWEVVIADEYDGHGNLWRTHFLGLLEAYDAQVMYQAPWILHDLISGNYFVEALGNERKEPIEWDKPHKWADFQIDAIRRRGVR